MKITQRLMDAQTSIDLLAINRKSKNKPIIKCAEFQEEIEFRWFHIVRRLN